VLGTARSKRFATPEGQKTAREHIAKADLRGILVIGGNGSLTGARTLADIQTKGGPLLVGGVPASIDNDLACTSMAIGVDTAMNTIVEACDRVFDTATAHKRTFIVEVMGRDCGYLAMTAGIAAGADAVLVRESDKEESQIVDQVVATMQRAYAQAGDAKRRVLVIKSEGVRMDSAKLKAEVDARIATLLPDVDTRVTVLGHVVRGGAPSAFDRLLAARLSNVALRAMAAGQSDFMAGWSGPGIARAGVSVGSLRRDHAAHRGARGDGKADAWRLRAREVAKANLPGSGEHPAALTVARERHDRAVARRGARD